MKALILVTLLLSGCADLTPREEAAITIGTGIVVAGVVLATRHHADHPGHEIIAIDPIPEYRH